MFFICFVLVTLIGSDSNYSLQYYSAKEACTLFTYIKSQKRSKNKKDSCKYLISDLSTWPNCRSKERCRSVGDNQPSVVLCRWKLGQWAILRIIYRFFYSWVIKRSSRQKFYFNAYFCKQLFSSFIVILSWDRTPSTQWMRGYVLKGRNGQKTLGSTPHKEWNEYARLKSSHPCWQKLTYFEILHGIYW